MEGNIVVDGVLASCYPSVQHEVALIGMSPIRWFPTVAQWMFGIDQGFQIFAKIENDIGWLTPFNLQY